MFGLEFHVHDRKSGAESGRPKTGALISRYNLFNSRRACRTGKLQRASPEWRNWQTRWTQNPVVLSTVWVRPPPPGPKSAERWNKSKWQRSTEKRLAFRYRRLLGAADDPRLSYRNRNLPAHFFSCAFLQS